MPLADYSALDRPEILRFLFRPRKDYSAPPPNATDHLVEVESGISIGCRFYIHSQDLPTILYFHGNGEVVYDYDGLAPLYNRLGINLFVADYRGYGSSNGTPTISNMFADAHSILDYLHCILREGLFNDSVFVMGRSVGSLSAVELAFNNSEQIKGLIVESGCGGIRNMFVHLGYTEGALLFPDDEFPNLPKIRAITLPTLVIHAELDNIVPLYNAQELFENAADKNKRMVIIPDAGHNDLMLVGMETYFEAIREFVFG